VESKNVELIGVKSRMTVMRGLGVGTERGNKKGYSKVTKNVKQNQKAAQRGSH
jgi:hypothetical protein